MVLMIGMIALLVGCGAPQTAVQRSTKGQAFDVSVIAYASDNDRGVRAITEALERVEHLFNRTINTIDPPELEALAKAWRTFTDPAGAPERSSWELKGCLRMGLAADIIQASLAERGFSRTKISSGRVLLLGDGPPRTKGWRVSLPNGPTWKRLRRVAIWPSDLWRVGSPTEQATTKVPRHGTVALMASDGADVGGLLGSMTDDSPSLTYLLDKAAWKKLLAKSPGMRAWVSAGDRWIAMLP